MKRLMFVLLLLPEAVLSQAPREIRIGFLPALTGPFADLGEDCRRGTQASRSVFGDGAAGAYRISFLTGDSQADPKVGVSEFNRLVRSQKILALLTMRSNVGMALNPLSKNQKLSLIGMVGHHRFVPENEYAFQFWPSVDEEGGILARYLVQQGQLTAGMITAEDEWNLSLSAKFKEAYERQGGRVLVEENVPSGETDVSPLLAKLRNKSLQALFVNLGLYPGAAAVRRIREQQIQFPLYSNYWIADDAAIRAAGDGATEGVLFPESRLDYPRFEAALGKLGIGKRTSGMTFACYAAYAALVRVLQSDAGIQTTEEFYRALSALSTLDVIDAELPLSDRRLRFDLTMKQIRGGKVLPASLKER